MKTLQQQLRIASNFGGRGNLKSSTLLGLRGPF